MIALVSHTLSVSAAIICGHEAKSAVDILANPVPPLVLASERPRQVRPEQGTAPLVQIRLSP